MKEESKKIAETLLSLSPEEILVKIRTARIQNASDKVLEILVMAYEARSRERLIKALGEG